MKKEKIVVVFAVAVLAGFLAACGGKSTTSEITIDLSNDTSETIKGSGKSISTEVDIPDGIYQLSMEGISSSNSNLKIVIDPTESTSKMECDDNVAEYFSVQVDEENQKINIVGDSSVFYDSINCTITLNASICAVSVDGSTEVEYTVADEVSSVKIEEMGSCSVIVYGSCESAEFELFGSSSLNASDLKAVNVEVSAAGSSDADVYAENELTVDASGSSSIRYSGNPQTVNQETSGSSSIEKNKN